MDMETRYTLRKRLRPSVGSRKKISNSIFLIDRTPYRGSMNRIANLRDRKCPSDELTSARDKMTTMMVIMSMCREAKARNYAIMYRATCSTKTSRTALYAATAAAFFPVNVASVECQRYASAPDLGGGIHYRGSRQWSKNVECKKNETTRI